MKKKEIYDALKEAGVPLEPISNYKTETLREMLDTLPPVSQPEPDALEKFDADSAAMEHEEDILPEDESYYPCYPKFEQQEEQSEPEVEIHTLYFTGGGWCNETGTSYSAGYYRPKTVSEYLALRQYAAKEL